MATLSLLKFSSPDGAAQMAQRLSDLQKQKLLTVLDGAIVRWDEGKKKPKTKQLVSTVGAGAVGGAFWGMLFGLLFFVPLFGLAVGALSGALAGKFTDYGINDDFIKQSRDKITPGTSGLFLLTRDVIVDKVAPAVRDLPFELVSTNLTQEQEDRLLAELGEPSDTDAEATGA
jgi:uncharacterized membrane protein